MHPELFPDLHPDLHRLAMVDDHDRHIDRMQNDKRALDAGVVQARAAVKTAEAELGASGDAIRANTKTQRELDRNVEKYEARRTSAQRVLEGGGGDPEAAERQVIQVAEILDGFETEQLERMEDAEALDIRENTAKACLDQARITVRELTEAHPSAVAALRADYKRVLPLRDAVFAELDRHTQQKYEGLVSRKNRAVSPIVDESCKACNRFVQPQHLADLKRGLLQPCRGCGRWLRVGLDG